MTDLLLGAVEYGSYISIIKLGVYVLLFLGTLPLIAWVHEDATSIGTKDVLWSGVVFGVAAAAAVLWLLIPIFILGSAFYVVLVATASLSYVVHRNAQVMEYDRVLTADHLKGLLAGKNKKTEALKGLVFVTANKNEVPIPPPKTPDFFGYKEAHDLFTDALWRRVMEIIFVPGPQQYKVVYQIDGMPTPRPAMGREQVDYLVRFMKNVADLDNKEKRKPQKGKFRIERDKERFEWEMQTAGSTAGEQVVIRRKTGQQILSLDDIGLMSNQLESLRQIRQMEQGLFIVSGPRKSGVTTTMYALLKNHDAFMNSIFTLEREVMADVPNITQERFSFSDTGTTSFAEKLETLFRMGPDIVGVAECPDKETAEAVCKAANDQKIVYLVLEADSVIKALDKWVRLVGDKNKALQGLVGISNQRLLRKLCAECKQAYAPNAELLRKFSLPADRAKVLYRAGKVQYDKHGKPHTCEGCQGMGYVGRMAVFEVIALDNNLQKSVMQAGSIAEIASRFRAAKMLYLQEQSLRKIIGGVTSINEMVRVLAKPQDKVSEGAKQKQD